ncbi:MAG: pentapeptide repeat-containing protein [Planctomycetota bacterium]|nr:pentapeptide repeat-containing protein [Planctomycetota bacterium]
MRKDPVESGQQELSENLLKGGGCSYRHPVYSDYKCPFRANGDGSGMCSVHAHERDKDFPAEKVRMVLEHFTEGVGRQAPEWDLYNADFESADLSNFEFFRCKLNSSDLSWSMLLNSAVVFCSFDNSDFTHARLKGMKCVRSFFAKANLCASSLEMATLKDSNFSNARLRAADIRLARISNCNFSECDADRAVISSTSLKYTDFVGASLREADFRYSYLAGVDFSGCDLTNADFTGAMVAQNNLQRRAARRHKRPYPLTSAFAFDRQRRGVAISLISRLAAFCTYSV